MRTALHLSSRLLRISVIALMMASSTLPGSSEALAQTLVIETADGSANNVGVFTSLALDPSGNPHVSYQDGTLGDLKYARKSGGAWTIETADGSANVVGSYTSLELDGTRNPHIAYTDATNGNLLYARKSADVWIIETVDGSANDLGYYTSLELDASGNPHVSYVDVTNSNLLYARKSGGVWTRETADGSANDVGYYTSLALDASGNPHVSHRDFSTNDLLYARKSGGVWILETADGSAGSVGSYTSLALDASGNPHVSYLDGTNGNLLYARKSGGIWTRETADGSADNVGYYTSLALDALGNPYISYFANTTFNLMFARRVGGAWTIETADGSSNQVGSYTSLALDVSGNPHVSYHDATTGDLKYAYIPSLLIAAPAPGATWPVGSKQTIEWTYTGGLGTDNTDVFLSLDGGNTYSLIGDDARDFELKVRVPHTPTRFARIKLVQPSPFTVAYLDSFFTIDATIALQKFDAVRDASGDDTRLTWETQPGPEADIRFRVERATDGAVFVSIADGLARGEFVDPTPTATSRYRLIAVNGLGEEYVLGETSVTAALAADRDIVAYPNPAGAPVQISFRVLTDRPLALDVFDTSGRRVRSLVSGNLPAGVHSATWDRRDESGRDVSAGTYFLRMRSAIGYDVTERVTIVR